MTTLNSRSVAGVGSLRAILLGGAACATFAAMPGVALAQDAETDEEAIEGPVILVQARKQNESLQEVPVTVTAIGGETLEKFSVDNVSDVTSRVPTLNVQVGGSGSGGQLSLRGVGSSNISAAFDSAVAFDFDGVTVSTMRLVQPGFFDVAQIDVLKGPQSLFFGKSATAGVFALRSADPTPNWEVGGRASYEFEEKGYLLSGYISGPISDTLGVRLAAQWNDIEEFALAQPGLPVANPERGLSDFITRLTLDWQPSDRFRANFKLQYSENRNDGAIGTAEIGCGANGLPDPIFLLGGAVVIPGGHDCNISDQRYASPDAAPQLAPGVPTVSPSAPFVRVASPAAGRNGVPFGETNILFGRLQFELDLSESLALTSVSGFLDMDAVDFDCYGYVGVLPGNTPGGVGCSDPINSLEQYTQELRLASDLDGPFNFMLGAFYEDRTFIFDTAQQGVNISFLSPDPITGFTYDWDKVQTTKTEALSFFGSAIIDLTEQLELSGGIRYTDEKKTSFIEVPYLHLFLQGPGFVAPGFFSGPIEFQDSNWSPEVTLRYQAGDDFNVFASFKTGFKSGGVDNSALPSNSLSVAALSGDFSGLIFDSEEAIGGEIGFKSQWADRSVTLNATAYYYVFTDLQVQNFNATTIQFVTSNAGELTTKGVDVDWSWTTPVEGLRLSGALSYLDAQYTDVFLQPGGAGGTIDLNGRRASQSPEFSGNFAADWRIPINDSFEFLLSGNAAYNSGYITDEATLNDFEQPSFWTIDATVGIGSPDDKWKLSLIATNLTDEIFVITSGGRPFLAPAGNLNGLPAGDDLVLTQNRGRQVFVEAKFKF